MPLAAKTAASKFVDGDLLWRTTGGLPQALILIETVKQAHKKPGTIIIIYSLLLPYISRNTDAQVNCIFFQEYSWLGLQHLIWTAPC
ncbi:protein of unknown function [Enterobacter cancerogenus]|nr:protein of unknown function [Enterobacter cancerogenus]